LLELDALLANADVELARAQREILLTYRQNRGVIVLDLSDRRAIQRRAQLRVITDANYFNNSKLRAERRSLEKQKRARDKESKSCKAPF
jgi:hypothetical protein